MGKTTTRFSTALVHSSAFPSSLAVLAMVSGDRDELVEDRLLFLIQAKDRSTTHRFGSTTTFSMNILRVQLAVLATS